MSKRVVYLLCGVSGSGKTWVLNQLKDTFAVVENDRFIGAASPMRIEAIREAAELSEAPVITDCPFGERELRAKLEGAGFEVQPIFIVEPQEIVATRYSSREGRALPKAAFTRAITIASRADEWRAPRGTSAQVLSMLQMIGAGGKFELVTEGPRTLITVALDEPPAPMGFAPFTVGEEER